MPFFIHSTLLRGHSRAAATSKMDCFVTKHSILDVAAALDPPLLLICYASFMLLLIQSEGIEINSRHIQRVMRSSFHQEDQTFGQEEGTECMCNVLYSVGYSIIMKICHTYS